MALLVVLSALSVHARTLNVGVGQTYADPAAAALDMGPGDTMLIHSGTYSATYYIENLQGRPDAWVTIRGTVERPVFQGGTESFHLTDSRYLRIENLIITGQTGNGMNLDDGGTPETPSHNIIIRDVEFRDIAASGNNDLLKMSGIDSFEVRNCRFLQGAEGGSGIDMVGCHYGIFRSNRFVDMGSNAIQAKGGTAFIRIQGNTFIDGGQRAVNLGGSTGLAFFRPIDAPYEAADIQVYSNVFVRGVTPIAYVGSTRVDVANNTIVDPERWVMRILQETVDTTRFIKCGYNLFRNNLIMMSGLAGTHVNVGPNTDPETFGFQTNLWYDRSDPSRSAPSLPTEEVGGIVGLDPLLLDINTERFMLTEGSPALHAGTHIPTVGIDFYEVPFENPPSIGAIESPSPVGVEESHVSRHRLVVSPNPASDVAYLHGARGEITVVDMLGNTFGVSRALGVPVGEATESSTLNVSHLPPGLYVVRDSQSSMLLSIAR